MSSSLAAIPLTLAAALEIEQVIEAPEPVFDLDVTDIYPGNNPVAHGLIELDESADCVAPSG